MEKTRGAWKRFREWNDECAIRYFGLLKPSNVSTEYLR